MKAIIDENGNVIYNEKDPEMLMAYYQLNQFFIDHGIGIYKDNIWIPKLSHFYPDFSNDKWILKLPFIIEKYACQDLKDRLHELQKNKVDKKLGIKPFRPSKGFVDLYSVH